MRADLKIRSIRTSWERFLDRDPESLPFWKRTGFRILKIVWAVGRDISEGQLSLWAMSLVYTTLITLVPLLAISFSVLKGFGVHNQIEPFLLNFLSSLGPEKSTEISGRILAFVDNVDVSVLGVIGFGLLIYTVIALMQKIEAAFNAIWRVNRHRSLARRFSDYLSVLLVGPVLVFISSGITTTLRHSGLFERLVSGPLSLFYDVAALLVPWLIMSAGFTFTYVFMPNTRVRISAALAGGLFAALSWKVMGWIFTVFVAGSASYVVIYAAFATLIVFMVWVYMSWFLVLVGSNIAYYVQNPRAARTSRKAFFLSPRARLALGLGIVSLVSEAHYRGQPRWTADRLGKALNVPILAVDPTLDALKRGGILASDDSEPCGYVPACPFEATPLSRVVEILERDAPDGAIRVSSLSLPAEVLPVLEALERSRREGLGERGIVQGLGG